jgi:hypothetical protein
MLSALFATEEFAIFMLPIIRFADETSGSPEGRRGVAVEFIEESDAFDFNAVVTFEADAFVPPACGTLEEVGAVEEFVVTGWTTEVLLELTASTGLAAAGVEMVALETVVEALTTVPLAAVAFAADVDVSFATVAELSREGVACAVVEGAIVADAAAGAGATEAEAGLSREGEACAVAEGAIVADAAAGAGATEAEAVEAEAEGDGLVASSLLDVWKALFAKLMEELAIDAKESAKESAAPFKLL